MADEPQFIPDLESPLSQELGSNDIRENPAEVEVLWNKIQQLQKQLDDSNRMLGLVLEELSNLRSQMAKSTKSSESKPTGVLKKDSSGGAEGLSSGVPGNRRSSDSEVQLVNFDRREAPAPEPFTFSPGRSFDRFISQFEMYCNSKFAENTYERWTGELSKYLRDDALYMYGVFGGGDCDYSVMKRNLKKHGDSTEENRRLVLFERFHAAVPEVGESMYIYALRLEQLFSLAYPQSDKEGSYELKAKFKATISREDAYYVSREEDHLKSVLQISVVPWSRIVSFLKHRYDFMTENDTLSQSDKAVRSTSVLPPTTRPIWYTSAEMTDNSVPTHVPNRSRSSFSSRNGQQFSRARSVSGDRRKSGNNFSRHRSVSGSGERLGRLGCSYCGVRGHVYQYCWRRLGCCLRCGGSDHFINSCRTELRKFGRGNGRVTSGSSPKKWSPNRISRVHTPSHTRDGSQTSSLHYRNGVHTSRGDRRPEPVSVRDRYCPEPVSVRGGYSREISSTLQPVQSPVNIPPATEHFSLN